MLIISFAVSVFLAAQKAKRDNFDSELIFNLAFAVFISGVLGARIFYVIENLRYYLSNPLEVVMLQRGGLSWFGGFILGASYGIIYLKARHLSVYKTLDLLIPFLALGQAIGRIGCLLNGCCFGRSWPIPIQMYSSLALLLIFYLLRLKQERIHKEGEILFTYIFLYSLKRFFV
ncbi:MAG TPA: prolipoprotein diacylglyceryl transferase family protein, partial [Candidatus Margulisiibacteriota bacterium]|nr:prolipoprotein diacylglyceryl transferase family protein [Candidatus Margulisiibacteriota bacterium]